MVLYDDKHNFLGMSSHTLSFLGYEDINDFLSMHNDFANLFVNQEGYIYNFDNFNWIDFVLYSGSANKSALIKLKNGKETKVDISIKEIHLAHDVNNMKKIYSVKILSDNFNEISKIPKAETSGFSLSGLVKKEPETEIVKEEENIVTSIPDSTPIETPKSESFILNIADDELISKEEKPSSVIIEDEKPQDTDSDFKLDFFRGEEAQTIEEDTQITSESSFLLKSENIDDNSISFNDDKQEDSEKQFEFNLLKDSQEQNEEKMQIETSSNFLQSDESTIIKDTNQDEILKESTNEDTKEVTSKSDMAPTMLDSGFKLDFLKTDLIQEDKDSLNQEPIVEETKDETLSLIKESTEEETNTNNQEIIQQIKDDIEEIDAYSVENTTPMNLNLEQADQSSFEEPKTTQVEQPIEFETNMDITQEEFSSFKMEERKEVDTNNSFTDTLKGLFAGAAVEATATVLSDNKSETEEGSLDFNLKSYDDTTSDMTIKEEELSLLNTQDTTFSFKNTIETINKEEETNKPQNLAISLSGLGLDADDEFNLLSDFIADTRDSIEIIEQFTYTKDFDKINYALVKIKSSAEILNLNDIIDNARSMRKHCITENGREVTTETQRLKDNISALEKQLEATAI